MTRIIVFTTACIGILLAIYATGTSPWWAVPVTATTALLVGYELAKEVNR